MKHYELSVFQMLEDDEPDLLDTLLTQSKDDCIELVHKLSGKLNEGQYFEIFNDEDQETLYFLNDGTYVDSFKKLVEALHRQPN